MTFAHSWCRCKSDRRCTTKENVMGKYFLGWLLGVPVVVLVVLYYFFR
jgi:hypothetical protein